MEGEEQTKAKVSLQRMTGGGDMMCVHALNGISAVFKSRQLSTFMDFRTETRLQVMHSSYAGDAQQLCLLMHVCARADVCVCLYTRDSIARAMRAHKFARIYTYRIAHFARFCTLGQIKDARTLCMLAG